MTTVSSIIQSAFREGNTIGLSETPETAEQTEALRHLQSLVDSVFGDVIGQKYMPWHIPDPFNTSPQRKRYPNRGEGNLNSRSKQDLEYPPIQSRVILRNTAPQTVYFQFAPQDGATMEIVDAGFTADVTLDANGMFFGVDSRDTTVTIAERVAQNDRNTVRHYMFREDTASWNQTNALVLTDQMPFPTLFDDYWITALALRLTPSFGMKQTEVTLMRMKEMESLMRGWYRQTREVIVGDVGLTDQSYRDSYITDDPTTGGFT